MIYRALVIIFATAFALQAQTKAPAAKTWPPAKTPWGDPDLQGTWTSDDCIGTPMNRPANLGDKLYFTEEELGLIESSDPREWLRGLQAYTLRWVERQRAESSKDGFVRDLRGERQTA